MDYTTNQFGSLFMQENENKSPLNFEKIAIIGVLIPFSIISFLAVKNVGIIGIFQGIFHDFGSLQIYCDLSIACGLILIWMYKDAKLKKRHFLGWMLLSLTIGSFGPLLYLLFEKKED